MVSERPGDGLVGKARSSTHAGMWPVKLCLGCLHTHVLFCFCFFFSFGISVVCCEHGVYLRFSRWLITINSHFLRTALCCFGLVLPRGPPPPPPTTLSRGPSGIEVPAIKPSSNSGNVQKRESQVRPFGWLWSDSFAPLLLTPAISSFL